MTAERVEIKSNDRAAFFGKTGTGKTYAAQLLIWEPFDRVIFFDIKDAHEGDLQAPTLTSLDQVVEALYCEAEEERLYKFRYTPPVTANELEHWEGICRLAYKRGDIHVIGDELKGIYQQDGATKPITDHHEAILSRGRSRGVGCTNISQRPKKIPQECITETDHLFSFYLGSQGDRSRVGEVYGDRAEEIRNLGEYQFMYMRDQWREPVVGGPL